jgi:hypothetical protein
MLISPICATRSNEFVRKAMQMMGHKKGCELVVLYLELVGIFGDGADDGVVGRDEDEAALRDLVDSALREILTRIAGCDEKEA